MKICPVSTALKIINSKWRIYIIHELTKGKKRNSDLLNALPNISQKVLTQNLKYLEEHKLITRKVYPELPLRVEYRLSAIGKTITQLIDEIYNWGALYQKIIINED